MTRGDTVTTAEGEEFAERMVMIEFPDRAHAEAWYSDPDYQAASKFRRAASNNSRIIIQEGRGNAEDPDPMV